MAATPTVPEDLKLPIPGCFRITTVKILIMVLKEPLILFSFSAEWLSNSK
jgi:hypothetical protein